MTTITARRRARRRQAVRAHPALRWWAGADRTLAHRRTPMGALCRAPGPLLIADRGAPLCRDCYATDDR